MSRPRPISSRPRAVIRVGPDSATLRVRLLSARLREQREARGMTLADVSERMHRGASTINRWEQGEQIPRPPDLKYLLTDVYGVSGTERDEFMRLADAAREAPEPGNVSIAVGDFGDINWLLERASKIEAYQHAVVPDLLQAEGYIRAILHTWDPGWPRERIERIVQVRFARQRRLTGERPMRLSAIVGEAVLLAPVGGAEARRAQLRHLLDRAALRTVELRVLPLAVGAHPGLAGSFDILRFDGAIDRDLALIGGRGGDVFYEDLTEFEQTFRRLRSMALSPRESRDMIARMAKEGT